MTDKGTGSQPYEIRDEGIHPDPCYIRVLTHYFAISTILPQDVLYPQF